MNHHMQIKRVIKWRGGIFALILPMFLASCATTKPPLAFLNADPSAVVIESLDTHYAQVVSPVALGKVEGSRILDQLKPMEHEKTVVVILENYTEPQLGAQFRERSFAWFMGLRGLGYQHIVFLQGNGVPQPNGLAVLAEYQ